jgi:molybdopterin converting factor small subunit
MRVRLSTHLRGYTGHRAEVDASGGTLAEVARDLDRQFPGIRFRMIDEQDRIREHIKLFVNGTQAQTLDAAVQPGDTVHIIGALSGG